MSKRLVIVTDAWHPVKNGVVQSEEIPNGVVRTLDNIIAQMQTLFGYEVATITADQFKTFPMPGYPKIEMAIEQLPKEKNGRVGEKIKALQPDQIYIATPEGPLGMAARNYCVRKHLNFTTGSHTKFPEYAGEFLSARGLPGRNSVRWLAQQWEHHLNYPARHVLAPTQSVTDELRARGFDNATTWTHGVDTSVFHPGHSSALAGIEGPVFLCVGRVSVEKNLHAFLDLDLPGTKVIVGDGPALAKLKETYPDVVFLGEKKGAELSDIYRAADVFVFPSKTDTFGNVQLEALASGVPVAAYNVTGPKDVITGPGIGALAQTDDGLQEACLKALELKRNGCEDTCVQFVKEHFTWEKAAQIFKDNLVDVHEKRSRY